jgi:signal transduction histidine kinase/DNA-binding response OmpR family regulator
LVATVLEIRSDGMRVRVQGEKLAEAWLPAEEWSSAAGRPGDGGPSEWEVARTLIDPGYELDVTIVPSSDGRLIASRKRFTLAMVDATMSGRIREMRVRDLGKNLVRGVIGDNVHACIERQRCIDWLDKKNLSSEFRDHSVLARGDVVRGFVGAVLADTFRAVELNSTDYLDFRENEIEKEIKAESEAVTLDSPPIVPSSREADRSIVQSANPILLLENDEGLRGKLIGFLEGSGGIVHAFSEAEAALKFVAEQGASLTTAIIDPNLDVAGSDLRGMEVAAFLQNTACRLLLITGEPSGGKKEDGWPALKVHVYLDKPFTTEEFLEALTAAYSVEAKPLKALIAGMLEPDSEPGPPQRAIEQQARRRSAQEALDDLAKIKPGVTIHLFRLHPRSRRARSLAQAGPGLVWERLRGKIGKSAIKDAATLPLDEAIVHTLPPVGKERPTEEERKLERAHLWTRQMMAYRSFCGVPGSLEGYDLALVAFHAEPDAFDAGFVTSAKVCVERAARAVERDALQKTGRNEALTSLGGLALASLAHEVTSDLTSLDLDLDDLRDAIQSTRSDPLEKIRAINEFLRILADKVRTLRGVKTQSGRVSITDCLRRAAAACSKVVLDTIAGPNRILIKDPIYDAGNWEITATPAPLIIVFFNLFLNAAQQIDLASGIRPCGVVSSSLTRYVDRDGFVWALVRVSDTGPGIHRDDWQRVFDPGYSTKPGGSGLGLYICRHLLESVREGGRGARLVLASSTIWDGTTFAVHLPLVAESEKGAQS